MKNRKYTNEFKECIVNLYKSGKSINYISETYNVPKSNIIVWAKKFEKIHINKNEDITIKEILELKKELAKVKEENDVLKSLNNCYEKKDLVKKVEFINENKSEYSINYLCEALNISTSTYYRHVNNISLKKENETYLRNLVMDIYRENKGLYGVNKIYFALRKKGIVIGRRKVQKIMKDLNLYAITTRRSNNTLI